ncbi:hypothetical protein BD770DRAFT_331269 [Pilaira anomala]|nr:hypothetical protein BD770DRAFT_331269 [Pilaira anomala]
MAIRENDLFVAVGDQIRVLNLTEMKDTWMNASRDATERYVELTDSWIHSVPYKVLDTPEINFQIVSIEPNSNGRLLSVVGYTRLVIICLPRQGFSDVSLSRKKVDCRTLSIGVKYYDTSKTEILKVQWHPLSETRTHIVVLGNDNILRMFDISKDIEEAEQSFDLSPIEQPKKKTHQGGFSLDDDDDSGEEDAVTFSLGGTSQDESGWEPFTVFYALRNGHMYSLCPVIPYKSIVRRNHLESLSCLSRVKSEQAKKSNKPLSHLFRLHNDWIHYLFESAKIGQNNLDHDALTVTSSDNHIPYPVHRQGPFLINHTSPFANGVEVTDILYIHVDIINVLSLALNNGTVQNYIIGSEIDPQWQLPVKDIKFMWEKEVAFLLSDSDFLPRASLYETIQLNPGHLPPFQRVTLLNDPLYNDTYYAYHAGGVHAVSTNKWIQKLVQLGKQVEGGKTSNEVGRGISDWLNQKTTSEVRLLVNTSPFQNGFVPIVGLVLITDIYLSYSLITLTSDYRLVTRDLSMRREITASSEVQKAIKEQLKSVADTNENVYQPLLSLPAFQVPKQLDTLPKQAKIVVPTNMGGSKEIVITDESLSFFLKTSETFKQETHELNKAAIVIDKRLTMQQKEFERQVSTLRDLYDRLEKIKSVGTEDEQEKKVKALHQTHAKLRLRIDEQLHKLMKSYQPDLSNEEKEWIAKLEELSKHVGGDSGYVSRIEQLKTQYEQLSSKKDKVLKAKGSNINPTQLQNVLRTLNEQKSSLSDLEKRFENLRTKLPSVA